MSLWHQHWGYIWPWWKFPPMPPRVRVSLPQKSADIFRASIYVRYIGKFLQPWSCILTPLSLPYDLLTCWWKSTPLHFTVVLCSLVYSAFVAFVLFSSYMFLIIVLLILAPSYCSLHTCSLLIVLFIFVSHNCSLHTCSFLIVLFILLRSLLYSSILMFS